jgi:hypothetical protein
MPIHDQSIQLYRNKTQVSAPQQICAQKAEAHKNADGPSLTALLNPHSENSGLHSDLPTRKAASELGQTPVRCRLIFWVLMWLGVTYTVQKYSKGVG